MRIYLDLCCLNRPFDDQRQDRVRLETEAVQLVVSRIEEGTDELVSSSVLDFENSADPDRDRRELVDGVLSMAGLRVSAQEREKNRSRALFALGFSEYDSLHLACAETSGADVFLTTDDRLPGLSRKHAGILAVRVENPVQWVEHDQDKAHDRE
jgi:predicted nucleic acid-binding protein